MVKVLFNNGQYYYNPSLTGRDWDIVFKKTKIQLLVFKEVKTPVIALSRIDDVVKLMQDNGWKIKPKMDTVQEVKAVHGLSYMAKRATAYAVEIDSVKGKPPLLYLGKHSEPPK